MKSQVNMDDESLKSLDSPCDLQLIIMMFHGVLNDILEEHNNDIIMTISTEDEIYSFLTDLNRGIINEYDIHLQR